MILTKEQQQIQNFDNGVALIHAGPGCGKTQALIMFIKKMCRTGLKPKKILVLTYNKNTVSDFQFRLEEEKIKNTDHIDVMTFHAFGNSLINENWPLLGFTSSPTFKTENYKPDELIESIATEHGVKQDDLNEAFQTYCQSNSKIEPAELKKALSEFVKLHQKNKQKAGIIDFDDMQRLPLQLFKNPDVLNKIAERYSCLLVDELQDINGLQARLIELLAPHIKTTIMVGDRKQMIYGFRQASSKNWEKLTKKLEPEIFHLTETFRCPQQALPMINAVAASICKDKPLLSNQKGFTPALYTFADVDEQADFLAEEIYMLTGKGVNFSDIACLSRVNEALTNLKLALETRDIPCFENEAVSEEEKGISRIIRDLLRITRWETNKKKYKAPPKAIEHIIETLHIDSDGGELIQQIHENGWAALRVPSKSDKKYRLVLNVKKAVINADQCTDLEQALQIIIDGIKPIINKRIKRLKTQLLRDLSDIKVAVRGKTWADLKINDIQFPTVDNNEGIFLSTGHASKGMEWKYVFLIHVVEGEMPSHWSRNDETKMQEEKMLFYVAITRHSRKLYILQCPTAKSHYGNKSGYNKFRSESFHDESSLVTPIKKHLKVIE